MVGQLLELRVHGVSNTPPADSLGLRAEPGDTPVPPRLVAGDAVTGFYRSPAADPHDPVVVEAYSWGQLTSGARTRRDVERALWTVLLPFTLANVALHARPEIPADPADEPWRSRAGINAWLIRLLCLSLTVTLVLAATGVGVDLIGWQCVDARCLRQLPGPWEVLAAGWWSRDARPLAVGLTVPLGLLAVIGLLAWRTYHYEAEMPAAPDDPAETDRHLDNPLRHPAFWCGEGQVRRMATLHLATGACAAAAVPLGAVVVMDPPTGVRAALAWPAATALGAATVLAVAALGHPYTTRRAGDTPLGRYGTAVLCLAAAGVLGTVLLLLVPDGPAGTPLRDLRPPAGCGADRGVPGCGVPHPLPGYDAAIAWLGHLQVLLLVAIAGVSRAGRVALWPPALAAVAGPPAWLWATGRLPPWAVAGALLAVAGTALLLPRRPGEPRGQPPDPRAAVAWGARGPAVLGGLGWLLGSSYAAGVLWWTTNRLNRGTTAGGVDPVVPPTAVRWAGPAFLLALLVVLLLAGRAWLVFVALRRRSLAALLAPQEALSAHDRRRARDVAAFRALRRLVGGHVLRLLGWFTGAACALAAAATTLAVAGVRPDPAGPATLVTLIRVAVDVGASLAGLLPVAVAGVGSLVYRNDTVRRAVGVVWDIGTFWPRSAHPLGPPSYAERAVPQLQTRATGLMALPDGDPRRMDGVILSGHSQGAVISAAVILQIPARWRRRIWFFSHGCQLTRLYGRVFPGYFGPDRLPAVASALTSVAGWTRWTNFWRETDPLGWPVAAGERELAVRDPDGLHPLDGEVRDPPIRSHGGYPETPEYQRERSAVAWLLTRTTPTPRQW
jgi:hypothetical protein